jgi:hypothetical protein
MEPFLAGQQATLLLILEGVNGLQYRAGAEKIEAAFKALLKGTRRFPVLAFVWYVFGIVWPRERKAVLLLDGVK